MVFGVGDHCPCPEGRPIPGTDHVDVSTEALWRFGVTGVHGTLGVGVCTSHPRFILLFSSFRDSDVVVPGPKKERRGSDSESDCTGWGPSQFCSDFGTTLDPPCLLGCGLGGAALHTFTATEPFPRHKFGTPA